MFLHVDHAVQKAISDWTGYLSITCWLFAQVPQVLTNYKNQSCDSLAPQFLLSWLAGDVTNLIGSVLTEQLPFQTWLATYFCLVDFVLCGQWIYYTFVHPPIRPRRASQRKHRRRHHHDSTRSRDTTRSRSRARLEDHYEHSEAETVKPSKMKDSFMSEATVATHTSAPVRGRSTHRVVITSPTELSPAAPISARTDDSDGRRPSRGRSMIFMGISAFLGISLFARSTPAVDSMASQAKVWDPQVLAREVSALIKHEEHGAWLTKRVIGRASAWMCTTMYLTSRLSQIHKNFRRRSVEGLSMWLFAMAFLGNTFYVASILCSPLLQEEPGYLAESIPFLLGSGGTVAFDITILLQSLIYSRPRRPRAHRTKSEQEESAALLEEGGEHHHSSRRRRHQASDSEGSPVTTMHSSFMSTASYDTSSSYDGEAEEEVDGKKIPKRGRSSYRISVVSPSLEALQEASPHRSPHR